MRLPSPPGPLFKGFPRKQAGVIHGGGNDTPSRQSSLPEATGTPVLCLELHGAESGWPGESAQLSTSNEKTIRRVGGKHKRERRYGDICICIADSLCCTAETNTTL